MLIMFYDFETNGLPLFSEPSDDPRQPHIVQACAVLVDDTSRKRVAEFHAIARPDGWEIPEEVSKVHGISTEYAATVGINEMHIAGMVAALWRSCDLRVAHNESFDSRIMRIALKRFGEENLADEWKEGNSECTAILSTPLCKLPPTDRMLAAGRRGFKKPRLEEAYQHFVSQELPNAHTANGDVDGCEQIYWLMKGASA